MELVSYLQDEKNLAVLEPLLRRLKLRFEKKKSPSGTANQTTTPEAKEKLEVARTLLLKMLEDGVDASYFGDPVEIYRGWAVDAGPSQSAARNGLGRTH